MRFRVGPFLLWSSPQNADRTMVFSGCARFWKLCCLAAGLLFAWSEWKAVAAEFHRFTAPELKQLVTKSCRLILPAHLEGTVLWVSPRKDSLYLQQDSNLILIETDLRNQQITATDQIEIDGECLVRDHGARFTFGTSPLVDNDGIHADVER